MSTARPFLLAHRFRHGGTKWTVTPASDVLTLQKYCINLEPWTEMPASLLHGALLQG
jgi:hypothetical protein